MSIETIILIIVAIVLAFFGGSTVGFSARHQRAAMPLHQMIVLIFGLLALACIGGGIVGIIYNATSETKLDIFGVRISTGHVGVAFVGIGLIIGYFTIRAVLRSQRDLAALPDDEERYEGRNHRSRSRSTHTNRKKHDD